MYFEKLALQVNATSAGWEVMEPPRCVGTSGVGHKFTLLASDSGQKYGFDLYPDVGEVEVLRTFIKEMDAGVSGVLVCMRGRPSEKAGKLAVELGVTILNPGEIGEFFRSAKKKTLMIERREEDPFHLR